MPRAQRLEFTLSSDLDEKITEAAYRLRISKATFLRNAAKEKASEVLKRKMATKSGRQ